MLSALVLAALLAFLVSPSIKGLVRCLLSLTKQKKWRVHAMTEDLAEVDGGVYEQKSVFECIEQGLQGKPDGLAVICMFQPPDHLDGLVSQSATLESGDGIMSNGAAEPPQQTTALWDQPRYSLGSHLHHERTAITSLQAPSPFLTLTYTQLHDTALKLAAGLLEAGVHSETTLFMAIPNGGEYAILLWACVLLRITYVSLDPSQLGIAGFTRLKQTLRSLKPQVLVAQDVRQGGAFEVAAAELQLPRPVYLCLSGGPEGVGVGGWKTLRAVVEQGARRRRGLHQPAAATGRGDRGNDYEYVTAEAALDTALVTAARRDRPGRIHSVMFTSGTSGEPKGCPQSVGGMAHALRSQAWLLLEPAAGRALMQPHNSRGIAPAQTLQTWSAGGAVILTGQAFDAGAALDAIERGRAAFLVLTPPMVHEMAAARAARPQVPVGCVRTVQVGGDTVTRGLLERAAALFPQARVCVNHGMTEGPGAFVWPWMASPSGSLSGVRYFGGEICPAGAVAPGARIRICDADGSRVLERGQPGAMHISCPSIIGHYWAGRADESFYADSDGRRWFKTGDVAMIDSDGLVFVLGRTKDMIRRAGVLVAPAAIESLVEAYTGAQTVVVPAQHHVLGAEPFVVGA
ncbi:4-coumarate--CoA ligase 2 [Apiospora phragmitis]|uniref:4-coumarate--CoA ligase 2 n=1 Tax=Apiospora phragmitis TaxID=2905665 RepID=A0ABR1TVT5_9PEZI